MSTVRLLTIAAIPVAVYLCSRWGRGAPLDPKVLRAAFDRRDGVAEGMRFLHDCDACVPINRLGRYDIYVCPQGGHPTVVAVYGDDPWEYESSSNLRLKENNLLYDFQVDDTRLKVIASEIVV